MTLTFHVILVVVFKFSNDDGKGSNPDLSVKGNSEVHITVRNENFEIWPISDEKLQKKWFLSDCK
jgi:hypothetical protein